MPRQKQRLPIALLLLAFSLCSPGCSLVSRDTARKAGYAAIAVPLILTAAIIDGALDSDPKIKPEVLKRKGIEPGSREHKRLVLETKNVNGQLFP